MPPAPGALEQEWWSPPVPQRGLPALIRWYMVLARLDLFLLVAILLANVPGPWVLIASISYMLETTRFDLFTRPAWLLFGRLVG